MLGSKQWSRFKLWDKFLTHCYLSFKANAGLDVSVPANLRLRYPRILAPSQKFNLDAALNLADNKQVTFSFEFYIKIDLDLLTPLWIPGLGLTDDFNQIYGGSWDFTFDINSNTVEHALNTISFGEDVSTQTITNYFGVNEFVSIRNLELNPSGLGRLAFAEIKISFLEAILAAAKAVITSLAPPLRALVDALDWLLTNIIKVDTGVTIYPSLNAEIVTPISSSSDLIFETSTLVFSEDVSSKIISTTVNPESKESEMNNQIVVNYGPLEYRLSFFNDWSYYLDLDLDFLGIEFVDEHHNWRLGTFPTLSTGIPAITNQITCDVIIDEPLEASPPEVNDGTIELILSDNSGISNVTLLYSTDKANWQQISMTPDGNQYNSKPIESVDRSTTVYYYVDVSDGDYDIYTIDNNGLYFNYNLEPEIDQSSPIEWISNVVLDSSNEAIIIISVILLIIICVALIIIKKKRGK